MIVVVEPTLRSLATAEQIRSLADDIKLKRIFLVGSKVQGDADREFITKHSPDIPIIGHLANDPRVRQADRDGVAVYDAIPEFASTAKTITEAIKIED
jgi:CO dehydrogenase maturation factor